MKQRLISSDPQTHILRYFLMTVFNYSQSLTLLLHPA